jgi:sulfate adenylyltransferase subunit 1
MSALHGDMIVERGERLDWYDGPTLLEILENGAGDPQRTRREIPLPGAVRLPPAGFGQPGTARLSRLHGPRRVRRAGGRRRGDGAALGRETRVKDIQVLGESLPRATAEQSVTILLDDEIDISRGDMIVKSGELPKVGQQADRRHALLAVRVAARPAPQVPLRHTTRDSKAMLAGIDYRVDINTMEQQAAERLVMNDIARVSFKLAQPIFADPYAESRGTGAFIVIDESSNNTVGAGMIV